MKKIKSGSAGIELLIAATLVAAFIGFSSCRYNKEEKKNQIELRGYVVPERFEAKSADLDLDGKSETVADYNGTNYLFRLGTNGVPYCQPFSIR